MADDNRVPRLWVFNYTADGNPPTTLDCTATSARAALRSAQRFIRRLNRSRRRAGVPLLRVPVAVREMVMCPQAPGP